MVRFIIVEERNEPSRSPAAGRPSVAEVIRPSDPCLVSTVRITHDDTVAAG